MPSEWVAERLRNRIAHADYEAVADPWRLISEQRVADVWSEYVREIGAPDEALVNAAEIHDRRGSGRCRIHVDEGVSIDLDDAQHLRDGREWENRWQLPGA